MKKNCAIIFAIIYPILQFRLSLPLYAVEPDPAPDSPPLAIRAINPGYTIDGKQNTNEFIELYRTSGTNTLPLDNIALYYTNSSGTRSELIAFPAGSKMSGENLLLRLSSSPDSVSSDLTYKSTLALKAGPLELTYNGTVIDSVCWTGAPGCVAPFKTTSPTILVKNQSLNLFEHLIFYTPAYNAGHPSYLAPPEPTVEEPSSETSPEPKCRGLEFTELLSYYENDASEQFIELYNGTEEAIDSTGCSLRYKKKTYALSGKVNASEYFVYSSTFSLTKNPTSANLIELLDANGEILDKIEYPHGQKKSASYAAFGAGAGKQWQITYSITPGAPNIFQEFRSCPAGKVINETTGNCVKAATLKSTDVECPAGKYRNPLTGRCKSYDTDDAAAECKPGYERNPETNRCRKIKENTGADFGLTPVAAEETSSFVALGFVILLVAAGLGYVIFQFRREILGIFKKILYNIKHETPRQHRKTSHRQRNRRHP